MKAVIVNYRTGRHTQNPHQMILRAEGVETKADAQKLVGKEVVWKTQTGKELKGKVSGAHGNSGVFRAIFEKGLPGQALGTEALIK
jgi:large subunit ribosomal protein L35Ae